MCNIWLICDDESLQLCRPMCVACVCPGTPYTCSSMFVCYMPDDKTSQILQRRRRHIRKRSVSCMHSRDIQISDECAAAKEMKILLIELDYLPFAGAQNPVKETKSVHHRLSFSFVSRILLQRTELAWDACMQYACVHWALCSAHRRRLVVRQNSGFITHIVERWPRTRV